MVISKPRTSDWDDRSYAMQRELANRPVFYSDLQKAVRLLSPDLVLEPNRSEFYGSPPSDPPERLADLVWTNLRIKDRGGESELIEVLLNAPEPLWGNPPFGAELADMCEHLGDDSVSKAFGKHFVLRGRQIEGVFS